MKALNAGYVSGAVWNALKDGHLPTRLDWMDVVHSLSHFVVNRDVGGKGQLPPEWGIFEDLLCRGMPTLPSRLIENHLAEKTNRMVVAEGDGGNHGGWLAKLDAPEGGDFLALLERALCICAPDAILEPSTGFEIFEFGSGDDNTAFDSEAERVFWENPLSSMLGPSAMQLVLRQRGVNTITEGGFSEQRVDVAIEVPGGDPKLGHVRGLVMEVDGDHHREPATQENDRRRDRAIEKAGWARTFRRKLWQNQAGERLPVQDTGIRKLMQHPYIQLMQLKDQVPLRQDPEGRRAHYMALFPFAVARLQRVVLELIRGGCLDPAAKEWTLLIIDRDRIPDVAHVAILDLLTWMRHLLNLYRPDATLPEVRVCQWRDGDSIEGLPDRPDAVVDLSVEMRFGVTRPLPPDLEEIVRAEAAVIVRSDYFVRESHHRYSSGMPLRPQGTADQQESNLAFFLQNIFRKQSFREKQLEIITRALRGESVIALLPTGAGKSITYQLPALLQAGMAAVVAPIKALMKDQADNLKAVGISCAAFINSMSKSVERRKNTALMSEGKLKFAFISPERLAISEFREFLKSMRATGSGIFAYAVVDEAHCVSEWGHDFRTAYLNLGDNIRAFLPHAGTAPLPILALTGTASFEVLDDVQMELGFDPSVDSCVRPESMGRKNLSFAVHTVQLPDNNVVPTGKWPVNKAVGEAKLANLPHVLDNMVRSLGETDLSTFLADQKGSALVFCPHAGKGGGLHGAKAAGAAIAAALRKDLGDCVGIYYGSSDDAEKTGGIDPVRVQDDFKSNKIRLLACTKAFGMGIDKPDVRLTLHQNMPPSLESFYQEAGRAGRDGKPSACWILYSGVQIPRPNYGLLWRPKEASVSFDAQINFDFYRRSFPSRETDERRVFDLLTEIWMPGPSVLRDLEHYLEEETGVHYRFGKQSRVGITRPTLFLNHPEHRESCILLDANNPELYFKVIRDPFPDHEDVLALILAWIQGKKPADVPWADWLLYEGPPTKAAGLEAAISSANTGPTRVLIPFENEVVEQIAKRLEKDADTIRDQMAFCESSDDFAHKFGTSPEIREWLKQSFPRIRLIDHTFKAVYRLSVLGLVSDYEVDYKDRCIVATLAPMREGECRARLWAYLVRRAPMEARQYLDLAEHSGLPSEFRRCLLALIAFVYGRIARQREEALRIMEQTCLRGRDNPNAFGDAVTYFFDSMYIPRLRPFLREYTPDLVFRTIKDSSASTAKLSHLLGACNRLLPENPENAALRTLQAFAMHFLGYAAADIHRDLQEAMISFERAFGWTRADKHVFLGKLRDHFLAVPSTVANPVDAVILEDHLAWMAKFNADNTLPSDAFDRTTAIHPQERT